MKAICVTLNPALDKYLYLNALQVDALNRTDRSIPMSAGGKGINVARALTVLGDKAINLFLSGGSTGKLLERLLHTEGQITVVTETVAQTRLNVKVVTPDSYTEINEKGGPVSPKEAAAAFFSYESVLEGEKPDCVVISGSIPTGMDTNIYRRMLERAKQAGILTMLDCDGISLKKGMETKPFLIKPNLDELRGLTGKSLENLDEIISICRELYRESGTVVLCTMGAKGAVLAGTP
jgi:1-phosphofructokinase family hexose kinase